jgi:hypothetical protein
MTDLPRSERSELHRLFEKVRKSRGDVPPQVAAEVRNRVAKLLER